LYPGTNLRVVKKITWSWDSLVSTVRIVEPVANNTSTWRLSVYWGGITVQLCGGSFKPYIQNSQMDKNSLYRIGLIKFIIL